MGFEGGVGLAGGVSRWVGVGCGRERYDVLVSGGQVSYEEEDTCVI
jgi:hypothetical protein